MNKVKFSNATVELVNDELFKPGDGKAANPQLFDLVVCSEALERMEDQLRFLAKSQRLVKPNGYLFVSSVSKTYDSLFWSNLINEFVFGFYPMGTHSWDKLINHTEIEDFLDTNGYVLVAKTGTYINPLTKEMHECRYKRSGYMMLFKKLTEEEAQNKKRCQEMARAA